MNADSILDYLSAWRIRWGGGHFIRFILMVLLSKGHGMSQQSYWAVVEPVWLRLNRSWDEDPRDFLRLFDEVPVRVGHLYAMHWCQSEVRNGGFHQLFFNTTGILAPEAAAGFRALELSELASIVDRAMTVLGTPYPRRRSVRQRALPPVQALDALDKEFFAAFKDDRWERAADKYAAGTEH